MDTMPVFPFLLRTIEKSEASSAVVMELSAVTCLLILVDLCCWFENFKL